MILKCTGWYDRPSFFGLSNERTHSHVSTDLKWSKMHLLDHTQNKLTNRHTQPQWLLTTAASDCVGAVCGQRVAASGLFQQEALRQWKEVRHFGRGARGVFLRRPSLLLPAGGPPVHSFHRPQAADVCHGRVFGAAIGSTTASALIHFRIYQWHPARGRWGRLCGWRPCPGSSGVRPLGPGREFWGSSLPADPYSAEYGGCGVWQVPYSMFPPAGNVQCGLLAGGGSSSTASTVFLNWGWGPFAKVSGTKSVWPRPSEGSQGLGCVPAHEGDTLRPPWHISRCQRGVFDHVCADLVDPLDLSCVFCVVSLGIQVASQSESL